MYLKVVERELAGEIADGRVTVFGYLHGEELWRAYASSDIFVFPSNTDTFGNVVLEAAASGLPVIVSDKGGPRENVVDGQTGFICRADDAEAFLTRILDLAERDGPRGKMGARARKLAETMSWETMAARFYEMHDVELEPQRIELCGV